MLLHLLTGFILGAVLKATVFFVNHYMVQLNFNPLTEYYAYLKLEKYVSTHNTGPAQANAQAYNVMLLLYM